MNKVIFLFISLIVLAGCAKKKAKEQVTEDENIIQSYITSNELEAVASGTGLHYVIDLPGTGATCNSNSDVRVAYKGYLTNGDVFDESSETGITFGLQTVIKGWTEGIPYFKEGGEGLLLIPSVLGYGTRATGSIPANSVLIFEINLIEVI